MSTYLLLGAGFSRNWGGWLASEVFDYLLGRPEVVTNDDVRDLLWRHKDRGGFELALAQSQHDGILQRPGARDQFIALNAAIRGMFRSMNEALLQSENLEFQQTQRMMLAPMLVRFNGIFTLNQDLLLEHRYANDNVSLISAQRWDGVQFPGMEPVPSRDFPSVTTCAGKDFVPIDADALTVAPRLQPIYKLHGSSNWKERTNYDILVIGGDKEREIQFHPVLHRYYAQFEACLQEPHARLMVIGYGFRDPHINYPICKAVRHNGLRLFVIDPLGSDLARSIRSTEDTLENNETELEATFRTGLIGASRRALSETFKTDVVEHAKVMRFFDF